MHSRKLEKYRRTRGCEKGKIQEPRYREGTVAMDGWVFVRHSCRKTAAHTKRRFDAPGLCETCISRLRNNDSSPAVAVMWVTRSRPARRRGFYEHESPCRAAFAEKLSQGTRRAHTYTCIYIHIYIYVWVCVHVYIRKKKRKKKKKKGTVSSYNGTLGKIVISLRISAELVRAASLSQYRGPPGPRHVLVAQQPAENTANCRKPCQKSEQRRVVILPSSLCSRRGSRYRLRLRAGPEYGRMKRTPRYIIAILCHTLIKIELSDRFDRSRISSPLFRLIIRELSKFPIALVDDM